MTPERARELLAGSAGRRVLLVGDLMMDEWVFGDVKRISPEAPIPVVKIPLTPEARAEKPGGAGNVAAILLGLGAAVQTVGVVGDDDVGQRLVQDLEGRGADVSAVARDPDRPTTHKLRIIAGRQQLLRIDTESAQPLDAGLSRRLRDSIRVGTDGADVVLIADYAKGTLSADSLPAELIGAARAGGVPFCADPKPENVDLFRGASLVSPNESETLQAAGPSANFVDADAVAAIEDVPSHSIPPDVLRSGRALRERLDAEAVFVTRGEKGIAVFGPGQMVADIPALTASGQVGDATGCGDAVSAASALTLAAGATYVEAAEIANAAGGVVSRFVGVHSPTTEEIVDWLGRAR
jgi:D-beta-D-heptose 7-phosphate kinase/D-beta-D-heptose 1-phosphate adenosyltransferase